MASTSVLVHRSADLLAQAAAARLVTRLVDVQSSGRVPALVLTGGGIVNRTYQAIAESAARDAVDWRSVDWWWGDERFVPVDDDERNEKQARQVLLSRVPVDESRVHPMAPSDGAYGDDLDAAAEAYAQELARHASPEDHGPVPTFDVMLLGVGPEGHVASLFPEMPALYDQRPVAGVRGSPKPPPNRLTLTLPALARAREVWFLVAGTEKARAVRLAMSDAGPVQVPAAGPRGLQRTLWLLDREAAAEVPGMGRLASP